MMEIIVSILGVFMFASYLNWTLLCDIAFPALSFLMWALFIRKSIKAFPLLLKRDAWIGWGIFLLFTVMAATWLYGVWAIPSNDDTINHLAFLDDILRSNHVLLGRIPRVGWNYFAPGFNHFYPTGAHGIAALFIYPFHFFGLNWVLAFKAFIIIALGLWPALLWWSSTSAFPHLSRSLRFFTVMAAATLPAFPLWTLGEGGFSRVIALIIFVPLWFSKVSGFSWTAFYAPILLFIHPCLFPLIALKACFFKRSKFFGALAGSILGGFLFLLLIKSAQQEVTSSDFAANLLIGIRTDAYGWFDRLKGPFHYWFSDPDGLGKFLSPKNWLIYLGLILAVQQKISRVYLLLWITPFALAALALIPNPYTLQLGVIFYHSIKRIAELTPFLGFVIATASALWLAHTRIFQSLNPMITKAGPVLLALIFIPIFWLKSGPELEKYHELYQTPKTNVVNLITAEVVMEVSPKAMVIVDRHEYDFLRFSLKNPKVYTLRPECMEVGEPSAYCVARKNFVKDILAGRAGLTQWEETWWLPDTGEDANAVAMAKEKNKKVIELSPNAHLIKLI